MIVVREQQIRVCRADKNGTRMTRPEDFLMEHAFRCKPFSSSLSSFQTIMSFLRTALRAVPRQRPTFIAPRSAAWVCQNFAAQRAWYSASAGLSRSDIEPRVLDVLKSFEKVDGSKVSRLVAYSSPFISRLFLTALCHVNLCGRPRAG